jgi:16S rRNA (cytosine967-C5)-methyltransferase
LKSQLSVKDKAFAHELVNGTLRWLLNLDWFIEQVYEGKFEKCPAVIKSVLEVSLYQILHLDKIPDYAAINEGVQIARKYKGDFWAKKVNAILRTLTREKDNSIYPDITNEPIKHISVKYSHPQWLIERWWNRYGAKQTQSLCEANNHVPDISIRVNRLKTSVAEFRQLLQEQQIEAVSSSSLPEFLKVKKLPHLTEFKPFQHGFFTVQDESAGLVTHLLDPKPGEKIIDLCAAPGGKTTHIAEYSDNKSTIVSVDKHYQRLVLIKQAANRLNLSRIHFCLSDARYFFSHPVDKVLVDAPCSGLGVLAKRSDLRWHRTPEQLKELVQLQLEIIHNAAQLVKVNGVLVYSTCTIEPEENEEIITQFLKINPHFRIDDPSPYVATQFLNGNFVATLPHIHSMDGSFSVRLLKIG